MIINVTTYGASTSSTDNYQAIQSAIAALHQAGGGTLLFPPGTYKVDRVVVTREGTDPGNGNFDFTFQNLDGFTVSGYGAKLDIKGNFARDSSRNRGLTPFNMIGCKNFSIEGFELDGNVEQMNNDANPTADFSNGIVTRACQNYTIRDVYVHHFPSDGVQLGHPTENTTPDFNATVRNVRSFYNGRQALSLTGVRYGTFTECEFSHTGRDLGPNYRGHAPGAGVDVEAEPGIVVVGHVDFVRCRFENNAGPQITAGGSERAENINFRDCVVSVVTPNTDNRYAVIFAVNGGVMENCTLDLATGNLHVAYGAQPKTNVTIRNCTIRSYNLGIVNLDEADVLIEGCRLISTVQTPQGSGDYLFPLIINSRLRWIGNYVFRSRESYATSWQGVSNRAAVINCREARGNEYATDLDANADNRHFWVDYGSTPVVQDDRFVNTTFIPEGPLNPGARADYLALVASYPTFRPAFNTMPPVLPDPEKSRLLRHAFVKAERVV